MKNQVTKFLGNPPKSKPDQFNQALAHYRQSKNHDASQVRFMNAMGFSEGRLEILLYELKKLHGITDLEVANAKGKKQEPRDKKQDAVSPEQQLLEEIQALDGMIFHSSEDLKEAKDSFKKLLERLEETGLPDPDKNLEPTIEILKRFEAALNVVAEGLKNDKETLELNGDELGKEETDKKLQDHVKENQVDLSDNGPEDFQGDVSTPLDVTEEETSKEDVSTPLDVTEEETSEEGPEYTKDSFKEEVGFQEVENKDLLLEKLNDFDVEKEDYNSIKSFAADVSAFSKENPADQKKVTLQAFILAAKKKQI